MTVELIAQVAHEVNRAYCLAIGDTSQVAWADAPDWQKDSAINGVKFKLSNLAATPEDQHQSWLDQKAKDGWVYGEVKDAEKKTHPCIIPYAELPESQKAKDYLFVAVVTSLVSALPTTNGVGDILVGRKFNPSNLDKVDSLKDLYAKAIDQVDAIVPKNKNHELLVSTAITQAITAQMWAVKATTF
jgi:hypothetical protein